MQLCRSCNNLLFSTPIRGSAPTFLNYLFPSLFKITHFRFYHLKITNFRLNPLTIAFFRLCLHKITLFQFYPLKIINFRLYPLSSIYTLFRFYLKLSFTDSISLKLLISCLFYPLKIILFQLWPLKITLFSALS